MSHYEKTVYEPIRIINHYNLNFNLGNVIKYVLRAGKKENNSKLSDLRKAIDYLKYEIDLEMENKSNTLINNQ